ncbi:MAG: hypothetical protein AB7V50_02300, partial [Vampirovibrionia bacterium]
LADEVMKLANLGHNIASVQKSMEKLAISCNGDPDCINDQRYDKVPRPSNYNDSVAPYPEGLNYENAIYAGSIGDANFHSNMSIEEIHESWPSYNRAVMDQLPNYQYYFQLEKVMNSSTNSKEVLGVIQELTWDLGIMGEEFQNNFNYMTGSEAQSMYDPLTGVQTKLVPPEKENYDYNDFTNYKASTISNFDSGLICASAWNEDTGTLCH